MTKNKLIELIISLIEDSKTAILATIDKDGAPRTRWITPGCVKKRSDSIYLVTETHLSKVQQLRDNPVASMMFQTRALDKIVTVQGKVNIINNPSILAETLECLGRNLYSFWKIQPENRELIVLEFIMEEATFYLPLNGKRETVLFTSEE